MNSSLRNRNRVRSEGLLNPEVDERINKKQKVVDSNKSYSLPDSTKKEKRGRPPKIFKYNSKSNQELVRNIVQKYYNNTNGNEKIEFIDRIINIGLVNETIFNLLFTETDYENIEIKSIEDCIEKICFTDNNLIEELDSFMDIDIEKFYRLELPIIFKEYFFQVYFLSRGEDIKIVDELIKKCFKAIEQFHYYTNKKN